jgi:hypothetical protein
VLLIALELGQITLGGPQLVGRVVTLRLKG